MESLLNKWNSNNNLGAMPWAIIVIFNLSKDFARVRPDYLNFLKCFEIQTSLFNFERQSAFICCKKLIE
jgi:hypothetical protein